MFTDYCWPRLLVLSAALLLPVHATNGHVKRQQQETAKQRWDELHSNYLDGLQSTLEQDGQCTWDTMVVRREWGDMTTEAKQDYISALHCMKKLPSQTSRRDFPGARSRFDDFAVAHLINTETVHRSPWLAIWHRHYVWTLEQTMREECGYQYGLPYWHWSKYLAEDPTQSDPESWPLFDGSETSISGNGTQTGPQCSCIQTGPLANWTINFGPTTNGWGCSRNPRGDGYGYNPRCIERAFSVSDLAQLQYSDVVKTVDEGATANDFASLLELIAPSTHNAPHLFMGGTQIEVPFSSQDPWFFFHHGMVEFVFAVWQSVDYDTRTTTLPDPEIFNDIRANGWSLPVPNPTLDSEIYLSTVFENITVRDAMWTNRNSYCYRYE